MYVYNALTIFITITMIRKHRNKGARWKLLTFQMVQAGSLGTATSSLGPCSPSRRDDQGVYRITLQDYGILDSAPADPACQKKEYSKYMCTNIGVYVIRYFPNNRGELESVRHSHCLVLCKFSRNSRVYTQAHMQIPYNPVSF